MMLWVLNTGNGRRGMSLEINDKGKFFKKKEERERERERESDSAVNDDIDAKYSTSYGRKENESEEINNEEKL